MAPVPASATTALLAVARRPVSDAARRRAALHVLDWLGATRAGASTAAGRAFTAYGMARAPGPCSAAGVGGREPAVAALVNGALAMALEFDDVHLAARVHPGPVVIPAAVAVAERLDSAGPALLDAVVRGYEVAIRVAEAAGPGHRRYWHSTATCGCLGAAAAAADLLELDDDRWLHALGSAGTQAGGLWQCRLEEGAMSKLLHAGRAAEAGVVAAELAASGVTGARFILDGPLGFLAAMCEGDGDPRALTRGGGWRIAETGLKPWPTCAYAHPPIEATLELRARAGDGAPERIEVDTHRDAIDFSSCAEPATPERARFSIEHCVATAWLRGAVALEDFAPERLSDAEVAALRGRVTVREGPDDGATVTLIGPGPRRERATCQAPSPMTEAEVAAKARSLLAFSGDGERAVEAAVAGVLSLADGGSARNVLQAVSGGDGDARR